MCRREKEINFNEVKTIQGEKVVSRFLDALHVNVNDTCIRYTHLKMFARLIQPEIIYLWETRTNKGKRTKNIKYVEYFCPSNNSV